MHPRAPTAADRDAPARWVPSRRFAALAAAAVVLVAALVAGVATRPTSGAGPVVGLSAPPWSGTSLAGIGLSSGSERGHWLILNFFATWCGPCQRETPELAQFVAQGRARVIGVVFHDGASSARSFVAEHHVDWPLIGDSSGAIGSSYRVVGLPVSFVVAPDGRVVRKVYGGVTVAGLDTLIPAA